MNCKALYQLAVKKAKEYSSTMYPNESRSKELIESILTERYFRQFTEYEGTRVPPATIVAPPNSIRKING